MSLILFKNVHVLDVRRGVLLPDHAVLVEGDAIRELSDKPIASPSARVIDGGGRTLMPGLIDCHAHVTFSQTNLGLLAGTPSTTLALRTLPILRGMLRRGFTTVRDAGGADWALKQAVEDGMDGTVVGPRLFVSGPALSPTGGHGDFRRAPIACSPSAAAASGWPARAWWMAWTPCARRARAAADGGRPDQDHVLGRRGLAHRPDRRAGLFAA
jgi:imidazolonepropionase-like amidohydrolase